MINAPFNLFVSPWITREKVSFAKKTTSKNILRSEVPQEELSYIEGLDRSLALYEFMPFTIIQEDTQILADTIQTQYTAVWLDPNDETYAASMHTYSKRGGALVYGERMFLFGTEFSSDEGIMTSNGITPNLPGDSNNPDCHVQIPATKDIELLHCIHMVRLKNEKRKPINVRAKLLDPEEFDRSRLAVFERKLNLGMVYFHEQTNVFRLTLKGAFVMTWMLSWPLENFLQWRMRRRAERLMNELRINE